MIIGNLKKHRVYMVALFRPSQSVKRVDIDGNFVLRVLSLSISRNSMRQISLRSCIPAFYVISMKSSAGSTFPSRTERDACKQYLFYANDKIEDLRIIAPTI